MKKNKLSVDYFLEKIRNNEYFSFSRFGDGEVHCIFPKVLQENCDGSKFLPELKPLLIKIFINKYDYYHCILPNCRMHGTNEFDKFIEETWPEMESFDGEIFDILSNSQGINKLVDVLDIHNPCFIGGPHLQHLKEMKGFNDISFIVVSEKDCIKDTTFVYKEIDKKILQGYKMFCFSAGYASKVWIDKLFEVYGKTCFFIDFGSIWDPYCGKLSRSSMRKKGFNFYQPFTNYKII